MDAIAQANETNLGDEEQFLISIENTLNIVKAKLYNFIKDISQALAESGLDFNLEKLKLEESNKIQELMNSLPKSFTDQVNNEEKKQIAILELECKQLRIQLQQQIEAYKKAQEEIQYLKEQTLNQSTYCSTLGAVLGNLTWRASRFPEIVDVWLSGFQDKIGELLSLTAGTFVAFINTYRNAFPPTSNVEYQFLIGLLGIVTNISASAEGREFLITNPNGRSFVEKMVKLVPTMPLSQGYLSLKKLMLMIFYNVSVNKTGLQHLFESRVGDVLNYYLENNSLPDKIQLLCLRVLHSITYDLTNPRYIQDLITTLPMAKIEDIAASNKNEMSTLAKQIVKHLRESRKYISQN
ncbi:heat shock factor 2-binding protein [Calliopsis andreniformis]|uniref:heat shock factor 2-binding protein n=1 Tax=Calliopsis andreniformis TaxID=337506 RepID=UPI003FCD31EE